MMSDGHRRQRRSSLQWIRLGDLVPHPRAQRDYNVHRAHELAADFNLEGMGYPVVSRHADVAFVIDGQHRVAALKIIGFSEDDVIQCEVYQDLSLEEEAEQFLERNTALAVNAMAKFRVGVVAGRSDEVEIEQTVHAQGLKVGSGGIRAVGALRSVYKRIGPSGLAATLRIIRDAYGNAGFEGVVIQGTALTIQRYNGKLNEAHMVKSLTKAAGGLNGLLTQAAKTRETLGQSKAQCVAATEVGFYNRGGGKRLPSWWKDTAEP